jgi:hypothetical protein
VYFFLSLTTTFFQKRAGLGLTSSCVGIAIHQYVATPFLLIIFTTSGSSDRSERIGVAKWELNLNADEERGTNYLACQGFCHPLNEASVCLTGSFTRTTVAIFFLGAHHRLTTYARGPEINQSIVITTV